MNKLLNDFFQILYYLKCRNLILENDLVPTMEFPSKLRLVFT